MTKVAPLTQKFTASARTLAYSSTSRRLARRFVEDPAADRIRSEIERRGHGAKLRRLASQPLPPGTYFAKLTIYHWKKHQNKSFQLIEGDRVVYGNKIEPPARGFELEYRNIIVTSEDPSDFRLNIDANYSLIIGRGTFTTAEQVRYDEQYGVKQHGDLFYSIRGNTVNPRRILVTFPGFGPSTSRISYAVSYLKDIRDDELSETLMICFQDRYMVSGTYMQVDNANVSLRDRIKTAISEFLSKYDISQSNVMFFGASKGGSIAIYAAEDFPQAHLVLVVPQMNLPYYLDKPFFRDNIYRLPALRAEKQPYNLMRRYFAEERKIDYFYTDRDEQSNFSLIEFVRDVSGLTKYRVDGEHSEVAKKALPTILAVMKGFLRGTPDDSTHETLPSSQLLAFPASKGVGFQIRLRDDALLKSGAGTNVLLETDLGATKLRQLISDHTYDFIKYTAPGERMFAALHAPAGVHTLLHTTSEGWLRRVALPAAAPQVEIVSPKIIAGLDAPLDLSPTSGLRKYAVLAETNYPVATYQYVVQEGVADGNSVVIFITPRGAKPSVNVLDSPVERPYLIIAASPSKRAQKFALFVHRVAITAGVEHVSVVVTDPMVSDEEINDMKNLYGPDISCYDFRPSSEFPSVTSGRQA